MGHTTTQYRYVVVPFPFKTGRTPVIGIPTPTPPPPSTTEHTLFSLLCLDGKSELNKLRSAFLGHASLLDIYMFPCSMRIVIFFLFSIHMQGLVIKLSHLTPECEIQFKVCHTKILIETCCWFFLGGE